jgi:putative intracellular protease/amidase
MNYESLAFVARPDLIATDHLKIGMLLYPGLTLLDLFGPQAVFATVARVRLLWKTLDPVRSDSGVDVVPNTTLQECPEVLDVLFIPGGPGQIDVIRDPEVMAFVAERGRKARYVTSVCTGALILGAAGLLQGYKATSHWLSHPVLAMFGAEPVRSRVVIDRNRITGGGVTAGLDFGLALLEQLVDADTARLTQLAMEYDPEPPFDCGSPELAGAHLTARVQSLLQPVAQATAAALQSLSAGPAPEQCEPEEVL